MSDMRRSHRRRVGTGTGESSSNANEYNALEDSFVSKIQRVEPSGNVRNSHEGPSSRRPRKSLHEEMAGDLVFIRESSQPAIPKSNAKSSTTDRTIQPKASTSRSRPPVARRNSMSVKGSRRTSSLRDGAPAYPHIDVPDQVLYRHCSDQAPPVVRMKHLLNWTLHRSIPQALGSEPMPKLGKSSSRNVELALLRSIPPHVVSALTEQEKQKLEEATPLLRKVIDDTLRDLNDGLIGISWLHQSKGKERETLKPHPRNESNFHAMKQLEGMRNQLQTELRSWNKQQKGLAGLDAEAGRLNQLSQQLSDSLHSDEDQGTEEERIAEEVAYGLVGTWPNELDVDETQRWTITDLDKDTSEQLKFAQNVLQCTEAMNEAISAQRQNLPSENIPGTETDEHVPAIELSLDQIYAQLHRFQQLDQASKLYVEHVARRASEALQERTNAGLATFATQNSEDPWTGAGEQQRLDRLLANIRQPSQSLNNETSASQTDARDLLRALARSK
ncbi:hypothetical protein MYAM1_002298 [Malassezia yamatoensis]|uniref:Kinetochore protein mis13 n=1 Tax=Malassezia yamatoensis TaxID=253288 RepID=A0AAJ6CI73_9BASI|nr:hypothetical protein MYAM1_002298 [Malassezia yamatoensis]